MNTLYFVGIAIIVILYIIISIRKSKLSVYNSSIWIIFCIALLVLSIWPKSLDWLAEMIGIDYPPALFLTITTVILFVQDFIYSKRIENLEKKVVNLSQEISIIKSSKEKNND